MDGRVFEAMRPLFSEHFGNPSSSHPPGKRAKQALEDARALVAESIGARPHEIVFTSGGTEANHLAVLGTAWSRGRGHVVLSAVEHPSVQEPCDWLRAQGYTVSRVGVDGSGRLDMADLEAALRPDTILVSVMHANNEVGTVQPVEQVAALLRHKEIPFHCDAAQSLGKTPVSVREIRADLVTLVSHKTYGPKGIGALFVREGTRLTPLLRGGGQERGLRAGTENTALATGFGAACRLAATEDWGKVMALRAERFWQALSKAIPGIRRNGNTEHCLPNTVHITFPGISSQELLQRIDQHIAASAGSACHADHNAPSGVLQAMGFSPQEAARSIRFSIGKDTADGEIDRAVEHIVNAIDEA